MSSVSGQYVRCPNCNLLNHSGCGICSECGTQVDEELVGELRRVASDVWGEVWRMVAAAGVGVLVAAAIAVVGAVVSRGLWLTSLAGMLTPPTRPGVVYMGPFLLAAVPIVWLILGRLEIHQFGGRMELFDGDEVQAGAWASGLFTIILVSVAFLFFSGRSGSETLTASLRPAWLWPVLPLLCQVVAIVASVGMGRWLQVRELDAEASLEVLEALE